MRFLTKFFFLFLFVFVFTVPINSVGASELKTEQDKLWRKKKDKKEKKKKSVSTSKKFKLMARDLLGQPHWSERFWRLVEKDIPKIAIHPFKAEDLPISLSEAQIYVDGFTRALIREAKDRFGVVGRKELGAVISDINEMGTRTETQNPLGELISRAQSDLLAVGNLALKGESVVLAYKLVETESGRIVSATQKKFKRQKKEETNTVGGLSLKGAARQAANTLLRDVQAVKKIMVQGLRYQASGTHTPFGQYFMGMLGDELRQIASRGPKNINNLDIADFIVEEERFRGLQLINESVERGGLKKAGQEFVLKGSYWVFDQRVEIRLSLVGEKGTAVSWRGFVLKSEIPQQFALVPAMPPIKDENQVSLGPMDLHLSSNKGDNPLYRVGEKMTLALQTGRDAYLSCYYFQADGQIFRIFPNRFMSSGMVNGGFLLHLPPKGMPFSFEFTPPSGVEAVKCFALDSDRTAEVMAQTKKAAFDPLPLNSERELTKIYRSLPNVAISEASLIITVQ